MQYLTQATTLKALIITEDLVQLKIRKVTGKNAKLN